MKTFYLVAVTMLLVFHATGQPDTSRHSNLFILKQQEDTAFGMTITLFSEGNYNEAAKFFALSINHYPKDYLAYEWIGGCEFKLGRKKAACKDYRKARKRGSPVADSFLKKICSCSK